MIVLDTHVWLWFRSAPTLLAAGARDVIAGETLAVSSISCWEVATLSRLGKIELDRDIDAWIGRALAEAPSVSAIAVSREIAVAAGQLGSAFPGDPADRIIFATAVTQKCSLVTKDGRLQSYAPALTVWK